MNKARSYWNAAQVAAGAMVKAAALGDRMGLAVAADDLDRALAQLWCLREGRDIDWQTILNHAQGMMRVFFRENRVEFVTAEQCEHISRLVRCYLDPAAKTIDDLNTALCLIEAAGFDPYAALSAGEQPDVNW